MTTSRTYWVIEWVQDDGGQVGYTFTKKYEAEAEMAKAMFGWSKGYNTNARLVEVTEVNTVLMAYSENPAHPD